MENGSNKLHFMFDAVIFLKLINTNTLYLIIPLHGYKMFSFSWSHLAVDEYPFYRIT